MIRFDNVTKRYDGSREALKGVSLHVAAGELVFLLRFFCLACGHEAKISHQQKSHEKYTQLVFLNSHADLLSL
jgi:hypothetical protein